MARSNPSSRWFALLVLAVACRSAAPGLSQADQDAIRAQIETYRQAALDGDWDAWGNTLVADVFTSPPNAAAMTSRDAAVAWVRAFPTLTSFTVNVEEMDGRGDLAYVHGTYAFDATLPDSTTMTERGAFLEIHRRQADGTWPYTHLMFHSTQPPPASAPAQAP